MRFAKPSTLPPTAMAIAAAASLACASTHPVSRAVCVAAQSLPYDRDIAVKEVSGKGMEGTTADGAHVIRFGNRDWMLSCGVEIPADFAADLSGSVSMVAMDDQLLGALGFNDTVRPDAASGIAMLRELGIEQTVMLTGDRERAARAICDEVGVDVLHAQLLPLVYFTFSFWAVRFRHRR